MVRYLFVNVLRNNELESFLNKIYMNFWSSERKEGCIFTLPSDKSHK
jgi:hypothetical protein